MRRLVALALVHAIVISSAVVSSPHVHEYAGHDHPEHRHGPAAHEHAHSARAEADHHTALEDRHEAVLEAESCDPDQHAVSVTTGCVYLVVWKADCAEVPGPALRVPGAPLRGATPVTDIRVHGPPFDLEIPSRAPPVSPHA